jgi:hypothetical protein
MGLIYGLWSHKIKFVIVISIYVYRGISGVAFVFTWIDWITILQTQTSLLHSRNMDFLVYWWYRARRCEADV